MGELQVTREAILSHMGSERYIPGKMKELARGLGISQNGYRDFRRLVKELEREGLVVRLHHNRFALPVASRQIVGVLQVHPRGFGFVITPGERADVFIPKARMGEAIDGDRVRVEVSGEGEDEERGPEGIVLEVIAATSRSFVGSFIRRGRRPAVEVDDKSLGRDVFLDEDPKIEEGSKMLVHITRRGWGYDGLRGEITEVLGSPDDPGLDFLTVVRRFDLPCEFSSAVEREMAELVLDIDSELAHRADYRSLCCLTIDPEEAKDFDDAISLESVEGGFRLGVHIADVSHFVRAGSEIDREAFERGTSVYLVDRVIHMLPTRLAADWCTLAPEEDRLALSVAIDIDEMGEVVGFEIYESVIRSAARLTYGEVQASFDGDAVRMGNAAPFVEQLDLMRRVSLLRRQIRLDRGSLNFDLPEPLVQVDAEGMPVALGRYPRYESHRLVEEFMLLANECIGRYMSERELPTLFRVHRAPPVEKLKNLADIIPDFKVEKGAEIIPRTFQMLLKRIEDRKDAPLLNKLLLKAMTRAEYAARDVGHFGLACSRYLHFTSPIRRYPDLLVHRILKRHLRGELDGAYAADLKKQMNWFGRWTSQCEQRAEEAERTYIRIKQLRYMEKFVGEDFPGRVSEILRGGFFVEVGELMVDGFCFLRDLDDYYQYDERLRRLVGRRSGQIIQIGMPVEVRVVGVNWNAQEMDLLLLDGGFERARTKKKHKKKRKIRGKKKR